jgi:hypothetical protein
MNNDTDQRWFAAVGASLCAASRWVLLGTGLAFVIGLVPLACRTETTGHPLLLWILALSMLPQIYLIVRIEFDRRIFRRLARTSLEMSEALSGFDAALSEAKLRPASAVTRSLAERLRGTNRLIGWHALLMTVQLLAATALTTLPA